jgi:hypothetical protein
MRAISRGSSGCTSGRSGVDRLSGSTRAMAYFGLTSVTTSMFAPVCALEDRPSPVTLIAPATIRASAVGLRTAASTLPVLDRAPVGTAVTPRLLGVGLLRFTPRRGSVWKGVKLNLQKDGAERLGDLSRSVHPTPTARRFSADHKVPRREVTHLVLTRVAVRDRLEATPSSACVQAHPQYVLARQAGAQAHRRGTRVGRASLSG